MIGFETGSIDEPPNTREEALHQLRHDAGGARRPVVCALYMNSKPVPHNPGTLTSVRAAAFELLQNSPDAEIVMIGVRPPADDGDDPTLFSLFEAMRRHRGRRIYVGPTERDRQVAELFGLQAGQLGLEEWLWVEESNPAAE